MDPREIPTEMTLTDIVSNCVKESKALQWDYQHFKRMDIGDEHKSYNWLRYRIEVWLREDLAERNKQAIIKAHADRAKGNIPGFFTTSPTKR